LYVAWAEPPVKGRLGPVQVLRRPLHLPPASTSDLALSSVIVADGVTTRETPYPPDQQSSHPYAIGAMEIAPSHDAQFTNDERLAVVFQVMNAKASEAGKPDIAIGFQLFRITANGEQSVGKINTTDKLSGRIAVADTTFRVVATPTTLLATAPGAPAARREPLLEAPVLREAAARLQRDQMTGVMIAALDAARAARFVDLLREDVIDASEQGARTTLRGIGLFALGDPRMAATMLRQALQAGPNAAAELYLGACRALEGNDRDAVAAWQSALAGGIARTVVAPLLVDAYLRLGELSRAADTAATLVTGDTPNPAILRALASVRLAQGRELEAIPLLEKHLMTQRDDLDAQYALLHALFASYVHGKGIGSTPEGKARFITVARSYLEAKGRNATVVGEWVEMVNRD
jgi:hypothetical protein